MRGGQGATPGGPGGGSAGKATPRLLTRWSCGRRQGPRTQPVDVSAGPAGISDAMMRCRGAPPGNHRASAAPHAVTPCPAPPHLHPDPVPHHHGVHQHRIIRRGVHRSGLQRRASGHQRAGQMERRRHAALCRPQPSSQRLACPDAQRRLLMMRAPTGQSPTHLGLHEGVREAGGSQRLLQRPALQQQEPACQGRRGSAGLSAAARAAGRWSRAGALQPCAAAAAVRGGGRPTAAHGTRPTSLDMVALLLQVSGNL